MEMSMTRPTLPRLPRRALLALAYASVGATILLALPNTYPAEAAGARGKKRVLVVTVTKGFRHSDSIPVAEKIIAEMGESSGKYTVDYVRTDEEMAQKMTADGLKNYDAVFFASTTGELPLPDRDAFLKWIADGHAFIGTHAATDTFHKWPAYLEMIGAHFVTHGPQVTVTCLNEDKKHPATKMLGDTQEVRDEIYQFEGFDRTKFHGLLALDKRGPVSVRSGQYETICPRQWPARRHERNSGPPSYRARIPGSRRTAPICPAWR